MADHEPPAVSAHLFVAPSVPGQHDAEPVELVLAASFGRERRHDRSSIFAVSVVQQRLCELIEQAVHAVSVSGEPRVQRQRSEEHTSELQSLMRTSNAVFCLKKHNKNV